MALAAVGNRMLTKVRNLISPVSHLALPIVLPIFARPFKFQAFAALLGKKIFVCLRSRGIHGKEGCFYQQNYPGLLRA